MEPEVSSEEKLLKLIRKKNPSRGPEAKTARSVHGKADFDAAKFINGMLLLIVVVSGAYIVWYGVQTNFLNKNSLVLEETTAVTEAEPLAGPSEGKPLSHYEEIVAQRDIFNTSFQKTVPAAGPQAVQSAQQVNPLQNLTLVGVVMDEEPQAIIYNQSTHETLFLKKGESVDEVLIEGIQEEKVSVVSQGQTIDLTL